MLRSLLKTGLAAGLQATHGDRVLAKMRGLDRLPVVVGYHRTVAEFPDDPGRTIPAMCISTKMLEQQLDWIGRRFNFVSLDELGELMESGSERVERAAAVTFDDGYHDFYEHAYPLLKRKGIPAAVFVVTDLIGTSTLQFHDLLYLLLSRTQCPPPGGAQAEMEALLRSLTQSDVRAVIDALQASVALNQTALAEHRAMTWEEVAAVSAAGITIGSHTQSHVILPNESPERVAQELRASREELEGRLACRIRHFAYPCGEFNASTVQAVAKAGYRFGYTICGHRDHNFPQLTIPRKLLWERACIDVLGSFSSAIMNCQVHGSFDLFSACKMKHVPLAA